jgi:hypothetical protein
MAKSNISGKFVPRIINAAAEAVGPFDVLLTASRSSRITAAESKDVPCPQIDLLLYDFYRITGKLRDGLLEVEFSIVASGRKRTITGVTVALLRSADVVFPVGFLASSAIAA